MLTFSLRHLKYLAQYEVRFRQLTSAPILFPCVHLRAQLGSAESTDISKLAIMDSVQAFRL